MPQWCDTHKQHTIDEVCPACEAQSPVRILRNLVEKIDEVHNDPQYQGVWVMAHMHGYRYSGPTYLPELEAARVFLKMEEKG